MKILFFFAILLVPQLILAQVTNEALPYSWSMALKDEPKKIVLPQVDLEILRQEDSITDINKNYPYRFGIKQPVDLNLFNSGKWTDLKNGDRIWRLNIESRGAKTVNFLFDRYDLPIGAEMYLYNNNRSDRIGPYTESENQEDGILGSWIIYGDNIWIEYYEPAAVKNQGRISIEQVIHGYRGFGTTEEYNLNINESQPCNVDVQCNPNQGSSNGVDWTAIRDKYRQAVARIIVDGSFFCTGTMINNVREDATPYLYTANHCLGVSDGASSTFNANNWVFGFEWFTNTPDCATFSPTLGPLNPTQVLNGASLKMNHSFSDTALFELNQTPPLSWNLYYGGWDRTSTISTAQLSIHHPEGDIMKLSRNDQAVVAQNTTIGGTTAQTWVVSNWDYGVTERGSSGGALINTNGHIIGELFGGSAFCSGIVDNGQPDYYGRFNTAWNGGGSSSTRLRDWLDPDNSAPSSLNGEFYDILTSKEDSSILSSEVYPNPTKGILVIVVNQPANFRIFDLSGKLIESGFFDQIQNVLNISSLSNGIYFLRVQNEHIQKTEKILKI